MPDNDTGRRWTAAHETADAPTRASRNRLNAGVHLRTRKRYLLSHMAVGAAVGCLFLHPVTMLIYSHDLGSHHAAESSALLGIAHTLIASFRPAMLPMSSFFILLGAVVGLAEGLFSRALARRDHVLRAQERQLQETVSALIREGEGQSLEYKSSLRWDFTEGRVNKMLEEVVVSTIAGFMNSDGGTLLIGVDDEGQITGVETDYGTLRKKNRDGFQQKLQQLIATHIGANACAMVHVLFHRADNRDVCRVYVEASLRPVYVRDRTASHFYLRTGNATRELDVQEAMQHMTTHWKHSRT